MVEMDTRIDKTEDFDINSIWLSVNKNLATIDLTDSPVLIFNIANTTEDDSGSGRERRLQRLDDGTEEAEMLRNKLSNIVGLPLEAAYRVQYPTTFREVVLTVEMLGEKDGKVAYRFLCTVMFIPPDEEVEKFFENPPKVEDLNANLTSAVDEEAILAAVQEEAAATPELAGLQNVAAAEIVIVDVSMPSEAVARSALSAAPSVSPSSMPSSMPSIAPTPLPSSTPSIAPTGIPSASPSLLPSTEPSIGPSNLPSVTASDSPSSLPSAVPSQLPSGEPTTLEPTVSNAPSQVFEPSDSPSISLSPSSVPSAGPSNQTNSSSVVPSISPSAGELNFSVFVNVHRVLGALVL